MEELQFIIMQKIPTTLGVVNIYMESPKKFLTKQLVSHPENNSLNTKKKSRL